MADLGNYGTTLEMAVELKNGIKSARELDQVADSATKAGAAMDRGSTAVGRTDTNLQGMNRTLTTSSGRLKVIARDINRYLTLPLMAFAGVTTKLAMDFNRGLGQISALIPDTGDRIYELRDSIIATSRDTGVSLQDLNRSMYRTISVFQDGEHTVDLFNTAVRASIAGASTAAEATQLISAVTRAYGDTSASAAQRVSDLAFEAVRLGDTTFPELANAIQTATDMSNRLGVSQEELFAIAATATGVTGDASRVYTQLRSALASLMNPTAELTTLLESYGYESGQAAIEARGLGGVFNLITREAERTGQPLQEFIRRIEGLMLTSSIGGEMLDTYNAKLSEIVNSAGATNRSYEAVTSTVDALGHQFRQLTATITTHMTTIGDKLLPVVLLVVQGFEFLANMLALLPDKVWWLVGAFTALAVVTQTVFYIQGALKSLEMAKFFTTVATQVMVLTGAYGGLAGVLTVVNSLLLPVLAIAAVAWVGITVGVRAYRREQERLNEALRESDQLMNQLSARNETQARRSRMTELAQGYLASGRLEDLRVTPADDTARRRSEMILEDQTVPQLESYLEFLRGRLVVAEDAAVGVFGRLTTLGGVLNDIRMQMFQASRQYGNQFDAQPIRDMLAAYESEDWDAIDRMQQRNTRFAESLAPSRRELVGAEARLAEAQAILEGTWQTDFRRTDRERTVNIEQRNVDRLNARITRMELLISLEQTLSEMHDLRTRAAGSSQEERARIEAQIQTLEEKLRERSGRVRPPEEPIKTWQDYFTEITGANVIGMVGVEAGERFNEYMAEGIEFSQALNNALGAQFEMTPFLEERLSTLRGSIEELLSVRDSDISSGAIFRILTGEDNGSQADIALQAVIQKYRDTLKEFYVSTAQDARRSWGEQTAEVERFNLALGGAGVTTMEVANDYDSLQQRLRETVQAFNALPPGITEADTAWQEHAKNVSYAQVELLSYARTMDEVMDSIPDFGTVMGEGLFSFFTNVGGADQRERIQNLKEEMATVEFGSTRYRELNVELQDANKNFRDLEITSAVFADLFTNVMVSSVDLLTSSIYDMAYAWGEGERNAQTYINMLSDLALEIGKMLGPMMMQAGLQLLIMGQVVPGLALLGMGLATTIGVGMAEGATRGANSVDEGPMQTFARGGVVNSPTMFGGRSLMGEAGWEGILPLKRTKTGDMGVQVAGGGYGGTPVNITVINQTDAVVEERNDGNGNIELIIKKMIKSTMGDGSVDTEMRTRYGVHSRGSR